LYIAEAKFLTMYKLLICTLAIIILQACKTKEIVSTVEQPSEVIDMTIPPGPTEDEMLGTHVHHNRRTC